MKKLLTLLLLITFYSGYTQNPSEVTGTPIKLNNLIIAEHDFFTFETLEDAEKLCKSLGPDFRLPTYEELNFLFDNRFRIGGFEESYYLSSKKMGGRFFFKNLQNGWERNYKEPFNNIYQKKRIRPVKGFLTNYLLLEKNKNLLISTGEILGDFSVSSNDFNYLMTWEEANKACLTLGPGWRLPTKNELISLSNDFTKKIDYGGFEVNTYWSSTKINNMYWTQFMSQGGEAKPFSKTEKFKVRAVKDCDCGPRNVTIKK